MANDAALPRALPLWRGSALRDPWLIAGLALLALLTFWSATGTTPVAVTLLWKWLPALLRGLLVNIEISVLAVALGTVVGLVVGALLLSPSAIVRRIARLYVQAFRNAPVLVLPWMNLYASITMSTSLASLVGVHDVVDMAQIASNTVVRTDFTILVYFTLLALFFAYCYPIARATRALERRHERH